MTRSATTVANLATLPEIAAAHQHEDGEIPGPARQHPATGVDGHVLHAAETQEAHRDATEADRGQTLAIAEEDHRPSTTDGTAVSAAITGAAAGTDLRAPNASGATETVSIFLGNL